MSSLCIEPIIFHCFRHPGRRPRGGAVLAAILLIFTAAAGAPLQGPLVKEVRFSGNRLLTASQLRKAMETRPSHFWSKSAYSHVKLEADLSVLQGLYEEHGCLDADVILEISCTTRRVPMSRFS